MMDEDGEWHYKCVLEDRLHDRLADPSWSGIDTQGVVDCLLEVARRAWLCAVDVECAPNPT